MGDQVRTLNNAELYVLRHENGMRTIYISQPSKGQFDNLMAFKHSKRFLIELSREEAQKLAHELETEGHSSYKTPE